MRMSQLHYLPADLPFFSILVGLFLLLVLLIQIGALRYAYRQLGIGSGGALLLLLGSLAGSSINIPVAELPDEQVVAVREVPYYGMRYSTPVVLEWPGTVIAVNVGGALIPTVMSLWLLARHRLWGRGLAATAVVAVVCYLLANPMPGIGITLPVFVPAAAAALAAIVLSRERAAVLAYVAGSLGTLIGADLANLDKIRGLGAAVASIGGAGTFDGIFIAGIVAVLIASLASPRKDAPLPAG
jgi:uncharacterized membrane protein